jgi:hypothetical protein
MAQDRILPDLIDRPAAAMRAVVARPKSWWIAAAIVLVTLLAYASVTGPYQQAAQAEAQAAMVERLAAQASPEQAEAMRASVEAASAQRPIVTTLLITAVRAAFGWLLWAGGAHLGSLFFGGRGEFAHTWAVTVWSQLPRALGYLATMIYTWMNDAIPAHEGLAFLVGTGDLLRDAANPAYLALSSISPFAIWSLILLIVGVRAATGLGRTAAIILILLLWGLGLALTLVPSLLMGGLTASLMG